MPAEDESVDEECAMEWETSAGTRGVEVVCNTSESERTVTSTRKEPIGCADPAFLGLSRTDHTRVRFRPATLGHLDLSYAR